MSAHAVLEQARARDLVAWKRHVGILHQSVRVDFSLQSDVELIANLKWLANELPAIITRIEILDDQEGRLYAGQCELQRVRAVVRAPKRDR